MKKLLLLIATCVLFVSEQEVQAEGAYAGVTGGLNWIPSSHHDEASLDLKTGYTAVGTFGYRCDCGMRIEEEIGYRYNKISKVEFEDVKFRLHGYQRSWSIMTNVLYNIPVDFCLQPYVGVGIGYAKAYTHLRHAPEGLAKRDHADGFTHQLIAGAEYPLNDCLSLDAKYRYQKTHDIHNNQSVEMGLVYLF